MIRPLAFSRLSTRPRCTMRRSSLILSLLGFLTEIPDLLHDARYIEAVFLFEDGRRAMFDEPVRKTESLQTNVMSIHITKKLQDGAAKPA